MADTHSKEVRSYNMSRIRSTNTKPEVLVRKFLFSNGFRYRLHNKKLPGKPDIVLAKYKTVIFVHGCFWHGHKGCKYFVIPKSNVDYWLGKIKRNQARDIENIAKLKELGWKILIIYKCDLKKNQETNLLKLIADIV